MESRISSVNLASLVTQRLKCLPAMPKTSVQSRGWEDPWRRKWQPTPVFLPGESHGWRSLVGYSPRGCKESDTTEQLHFTAFFIVKLSHPYMTTGKNIALTRWTFVGKVMHMWFILFTLYCNVSIFLCHFIFFAKFYLFGI